MENKNTKSHNFVIIYFTVVCIFRDVIENVRNLYSPYFPLQVVREYVMAALEEAVTVNQVHNRDPIGGSNENLFL